jgi:hypothetical protein
VKSLFILLNSRSPLGARGEVKNVEWGILSLLCSGTRKFLFNQKVPIYWAQGDIRFEGLRHSAVDKNRMECFVDTLLLKCSDHRNLNLLLLLCSDHRNLNFLLLLCSDHRNLNFLLLKCSDHRKLKHGSLKVTKMGDKVPSVFFNFSENNFQHNSFSFPSFMPSPLNINRLQM